MMFKCLTVFALLFLPSVSTAQSNDMSLETATSVGFFHTLCVEGLPAFQDVSLTAKDDFGFVVTLEEGGNIYLSPPDDAGLGLITSERTCRVTANNAPANEQAISFFLESLSASGAVIEKETKIGEVGGRVFMLMVKSSFEGRPLDFLLRASSSGDSLDISAEFDQ